MTRCRAGTRVVVLVTVVAVVLAGVLGRDAFQFRALETFVNDLAAWGALAFVVAFAVGTVAFLPGSIFGLAGGALFGPVWGAVWNLAGGTLGATLSFLAARHISGEWVARKAGGKLQEILRGVEAEGWRFVALMRLVPVVPFNLLNYALGLTRIRLGEYVLATLVCMIPGTVAYAWLGHAGLEAASGNSDAIGFALFGLGLLALIVFLPRLIRPLRPAQSGWLTVDELGRRLSSGPPVLVIDVREPDEFVGPLGHIPGARNIPLAELPARLAELPLADNRAVVLVCRTDKRSAKAAEMLRAAAIPNVHVLRGGMEKWSSAEVAFERLPVR